MDQIKRDKKLVLVFVAPDIGFGYIQFNMANGLRGQLLADQRLREAIDLIDRETLVKVAFNNARQPVGRPSRATTIRRTSRCRSATWRRPPWPGEAGHLQPDLSPITRPDATTRCRPRWSRRCWPKPAST
ncbi:MAG: hypothetical protein U1E60_09500 [Reyranellaceae bacterium]